MFILQYLRGLLQKEGKNIKAVNPQQDVLKSALLEFLLVLLHSYHAYYGI